MSHSSRAKPTPTSMREAFVNAINDNQAAFGVKLEEGAIERLADHYELVTEANELLHLVAPCPAAEFATRHVLESLTLLEHLPQDAVFADIGPGAGFPSMPCLIARNDLTAVLIESKEKKTSFLSATAERLGLAERVKIVNRQFEEASPENCNFVTCRALDKFIERLPRLIKWSRGKKMLLFGGNSLRAELEKRKIEFAEKQMPLSERRFLFILDQAMTPNK